MDHRLKDIKLNYKTSRRKHRKKFLGPKAIQSLLRLDTRSMIHKKKT